MDELNLKKDEEYLKLLEKKLGIERKGILSNSGSVKKRKILYDRIEREGMGDQFMSMLDEIISTVRTKKKKSACNNKNFKYKRSNFCEFNELNKVSSTDYNDILNWRINYQRKLQGLFNRLSEGNMTLITDNILELMKTTIQKVYYSNKIQNELLIKQRRIDTNFVAKSSRRFTNHDRLFLIVEMVENDLIDQFIQNCISRSQITISLVTVYSAVIGSIGISKSDKFLFKLLLSLNKTYNIILENILKLEKKHKSKAEIYNSRLKLRHIVVSIVTIYRCGFISAKVLHNYIIAGLIKYSEPTISNILYWECFLDNLLTILRVTAVFIKQEDLSIYEDIIQKITSGIKNKDSEFIFTKSIFSENSDCLNKQKLKFIIEEFDNWKKSFQSSTIPRANGKQSLIERQLYTVHSWSLNCSLIQHLRILQKKKRNMDVLELPSYSNTLINYDWKTGICDLNLYSNLSNKGLMINISGYQIDTIQELRQESYVDKSKEISSNCQDSAYTRDDLLELASKIRLNSNIQRSIFIALMGASDVYDAIQRITSLNLVQSKTYLVSTVNVIILSSFSECVYNSFYYEVLKGLTELPAIISKKLNKEIFLAFSQQFEILNTFNVRKVMIFSKLVNDCVLGGIFDLKILRFIRINDVYSTTDSVALFLRELVILLLQHGSINIKNEFNLKLFEPIKNMMDIKELVLLIIQKLIPASKSDLEINQNSVNVLEIGLIKLSRELSN